MSLTSIYHSLKSWPNQYRPETIERLKIASFNINSTTRYLLGGNLSITWRNDTMLEARLINQVQEILSTRTCSRDL